MSSTDKDIIMTGFLPDEVLLDYLKGADVVVFPSRGENASLTIMEAMACELPVISSDVGNAKKILGEDRGVLLEKYTEQEIAERIIQIISNDELANKIGKDARKYVMKYHSWLKISKKTENMYKSIIKKS